MSKKAEERALEVYPVEICGYVTECRVGAKPQPQDWNEERRKCFREGYEQAEKDLALTWEDMSRISRILDIMVDDDFKGKIPEEWGEEEYYEEVLRRFNKAKKEK